MSLLRKMKVQVMDVLESVDRKIVIAYSTTSGVMRDIISLFIRLYIARVYYLSVVVAFSFWQARYNLFQEDFTNIISPHVDAILSVSLELLVAFLLFFGFLTRLAAFLGMLLNTMMLSLAEMSSCAQKDHYIYAIILLVLLFIGPGRVSIDALFSRAHQKT